MSAPNGIITIITIEKPEIVNNLALFQETIESTNLTFYSLPKI